MVERGSGGSAHGELDHWKLTGATAFRPSAPMTPCFAVEACGMCGDRRRAVPGGDWDETLGLQYPLIPGATRRWVGCRRIGRRGGLERWGRP